MYKYFSNSLKLIVFSILLIGIIPSCKDNTDCEVVITVKKASDNNIVPNARVKISKMDINVEGNANEKGEFRHIFPLEAILDVEAWDETQTPPLYGKSTIRLEPGETVRKSIVIQ